MIPLLLNCQKQKEGRKEYIDEFALLNILNVLTEFNGSSFVCLLLPFVLVLQEDLLPEETAPGRPQDPAVYASIEKQVSCLPLRLS